MEKNRSMTLEQHNRALGMLEAEMAMTHVARCISVSHCTMSRLRTKFNATGSLKDRPCTGRPLAEIIRVQISFLNAETPLGKIMVKYFSK